jgi:hypothetical protein
MTRVPVNSGVFFPRGGRLATRIFLSIRLGLVGALLGHGAEKKVTRKTVAGCQQPVAGKERLVLAIRRWRLATALGDLY